MHEEPTHWSWETLKAEIDRLRSLLEGETDWCSIAKQVETELATLKAERNWLQAENNQLREEIAHWKWEYENVSKFATQYETERDDLRSQLNLKIISSGTP